MSLWVYVPTPSPYIALLADSESSTTQGRAAEEMMYGKDNVTDGASSDIQNATNIASALVRRFGFSTKVGPVSYSDSADGPSPSQETLREIDNEVRGLIELAEERAKTLLNEKKGELERLAKALVEYETLDLHEVRRGTSRFPPLSVFCCIDAHH